MDMTSVNGLVRAIATKMEAPHKLKKYLIQWEAYGRVNAAVVQASSQEEAEAICKQRSDADHARERLIIAREYDAITAGDVEHG